MYSPACHQGLGIEHRQICLEAPDRRRRPQACPAIGRDPLPQPRQRGLFGRGAERRDVVVDDRLEIGPERVEAGPAPGLPALQTHILDSNDYYESGAA